MVVRTFLPRGSTCVAPCLWATCTAGESSDLLILVGAAGGRGGGARRSRPVPLGGPARARVDLAAVATDLVVGLMMAGVTADWAADVRRRLCRVAFGQDLPTLETTPVGELLDRIDGDVYQVASSVRAQGVRIVQMLAVGVLSVFVAIAVWWPAGVTMLVLSVALAIACAKHAHIVPARCPRRSLVTWRGDGGCDPREGRRAHQPARPYVLRLYSRGGGRDRRARVSGGVVEGPTGRRLHPWRHRQWCSARLGSGRRDRRRR